MTSASAYDRTSSLKTVPVKIRVLCQNSGKEDVPDEEVEVHGEADRFCLSARPAALYVRQRRLKKDCTEYLTPLVIKQNKYAVAPPGDVIGTTQTLNKF
jgi:hypothetical protein